jgi:ribonuclease D
MIQLAGPGDKAPVGLIWLDKFPNHGRDVIGMDKCKPLLDILADYEILKVGVGASKDVRHLAEWWGINDGKFIDYYFAGFIDLEYEGNVRDKSLAEMCKSILNKILPKSKEKLSKNQKKRKKEGRRTPTAHWRRKDVTKEMKEYAANDAACGIDVWMKLKTDAVDDEDETLSESSS